MAQAKVLVVTGYGTNCERETAYAANISGAHKTTIAFFSDLITGKTNLTDYNFLILPGGFLDGDDLGAGQAAALRWRFSKKKDGANLVDELKSFFDSGGLILGICNGFQLLVKLGLLPAVGGKYFERQVSLGHNDMARFEDRWVHLKANQAGPCVFLKNIKDMYLPVRHGEGKIVPRDETVLRRIKDNNLIAFQYADPKTRRPTQQYPYNPNGSPLAIAGLTDPSGRILGLMPHPEAFNHPTNHPAWTRNGQTTLGTELIAAGIRYLAEN